MKKVLVKISLLVLGVALTLSPFAIFFAVAANQPHIYSKTYYAALVDKVHNLQTLKKQKKIVLVGGSNVAFGFNSRLIEEEFPEYKVVNFGLYAMLGTKIMMDLALDCIGKGDLVFVIPEINNQSTSLFFSPESTLKAIEDDMSILQKLPKENRDSVTGSYFSFVANRAKQRTIIEPTGVYQRKSFNKYGDISYEEKDENDLPIRAANRMSLHYDPTMVVDFAETIGDGFFDYLNGYDKQIKKKKAELFYAFSPVDEKAVVNMSAATDYYWSIRESLSCKVIGNPQEYVMDPHFFFDSNFHLNDAGAILRSWLFAQDLYRDVFEEGSRPSFAIPETPAYPEGEKIGEDSETAACFEYQEYEDSLIISGVSGDHLGDSNIALPSVANGKRVVGIGQNAFAHCTQIDNVVIPTSIGILMDGCFGNCPSLRNVYIETFHPSDIIVSYTGSMIENVTSDFRIFIHNDCFTDFATDYYWGAYASYFVRY